MNAQEWGRGYCAEQKTKKEDKIPINDKSEFFALFFFFYFFSFFFFFFLSRCIEWSRSSQGSQKKINTNMSKFYANQQKKVKTINSAKKSF